MNFHAHAFDFAPQLLAAHLVELFGHQHRREFDNMVSAEVFNAPAASSPSRPPPTTAPRLLRRAQDSMALRSSIVRWAKQSWVSAPLIGGIHGYEPVAIISLS